MVIVLYVLLIFLGLVGFAIGYLSLRVSNKLKLRCKTKVTYADGIVRFKYSEPTLEELMQK